MIKRTGSSRPQITDTFVLLHGPASFTEAVPLMSHERAVWLSKTLKCRRYGVRSVRASALTILVQEGFMNTSGRDAHWVVHICQKTGRFDGRPRIELVVRQRIASDVDAPDGPLCPRVDQVFFRTRTTCPWIAEGMIEIELVDPEGYQLWNEQFQDMSAVCPLVPPGERNSILMWHWNRYYRFLPRKGVEELAKTMDSVELSDINEANRLASRLLYAEARSQGWKKLTLREQKKYGVFGQWHRVADLDAIMAAQAESEGHPAGVGQYTEHSSQGSSPYGRAAAIEAARNIMRERAGLPDCIVDRLTVDQMLAWGRENGFVFADQLAELASE